MTAPTPVDHKSGDRYEFIVIGDDAFSANLLKGRIVMVRVGEVRDNDLHIINLPGARDLLRYIKRQPDGSLLVECARYPAALYKEGEYEIVGAVIKFRGMTGGWWTWIPDDFAFSYTLPVVKVELTAA